ncbi:MAG: D-serine ammonia-lyase [Lachnospiraceae bacterium]|nr:D-serine ammonia-lyase [Lachnospiraceae bacterium]
MKRALFQKLERQYPIIKRMSRYQEVFWINPKTGTKSKSFRPVSNEEIIDASNRLDRFAPCIEQLFPETQALKGIIESPLTDAPSVKKVMEDRIGFSIGKHLLIKLDSHLPVSGSVKARGGVYEVLKFAEDLAIKHSILKPDDNYLKLLEPRSKDLFSQYTIGVGSTGNLGLSIGIMGTALGFRVNVHMSRDAKTWKKELLRKKGAHVIEHSGDYLSAVKKGRQSAAARTHSYFIDDENSRDLFLGYSVAGMRLAEQLETAHIPVDEEHPLFVYLPCGVGGAPGGITYGIKQIFGDNAHCLFLEPAHTPCITLGMLTGMYNKISVTDIGLDGKTDADGLAVARPSAFVCEMMEPLLDGCFTVTDTDFYRYLTLLVDTEDLFLEPSACGGLAAFRHVLTDPYYLDHYDLRRKLPNSTHIMWATGGSMVPKTELMSYYELGKHNRDIW